MRPGSTRPAGWRRWAFPLAAATLVPLALLGGIELLLRATGVGHPTAYWLPVAERPLEAPNPRFGWRFFPQAIARQPVVQLLPRGQPETSYRIFVLGGSAAMGTPEPALGPARILELVLEERFPGTDFEVVNAAMAAVNSHVVTEIARDCARRRPDLFVAYLGNNEVVGPYGPGTVFGPRAPSRAAIRLGLELRRLRGAQALAAGLARLRRAPRAAARWRGMEMFVDNQVAADDPRLERTYHHLERNLEELARIAAGAGAPLVLSTVAVNLRDSPPFAALHRDGLGPEDRERWRREVERGAELAAAGQPEEAAAAFAAALAIDDHHAELHYRLGRLLLAAGEPAAAATHLTRARDLDALRFRADSRVNEVIRRVAATAPGARLVDAERRLAEAPESAGGLPGDELFWEHVHLNFGGNFRLAEAFADEIEPLLPAAIRDRRAAGTPSAERVAELLALTARDLREMTAGIYEMIRRPPFTRQLGHEARRARLKRVRLQLEAQAAAFREADLAALGAARGRRPHDVQIAERLALALDEAGEAEAAVAVWRELVELHPGAAAWRTGLGFALGAAGEPAAAVGELRRAAELEPWSADAQANLALGLEGHGRLMDAERLYREALELDPLHEAARINLALLLERRGSASGADAQLARLLELEQRSAPGQRALAELYDRRGEAERAIAAYREALELDPEQPRVHNNLGFLLAVAGRPREAAEQYLEALADDPRFALAYFNLGDLLLEQGSPRQAAEAYRAGLELRPDNAQARANLEQALALSGNAM